jgi:hypothetical protein
MLLRQIKVPGDEKEHGAFKDLGLQDRRAYAGHADLPRGHWVWAAPHWYIWRDRAAAPKARRNWGPEQAVGPPDAWPNAGDIVTAWASLAEDAQDEWLLLEYPEPVSPTAVVVYATFNPGALVRVTVFDPDGEEVEVWKGKDPIPAGAFKGISVIPFRVPFKTNRVKLYLASTEVPGWNEVDAVGLRAGNRTHWASAVEASSTYAQLMPEPVVAVDLNAVRLAQLEQEVRQLKQLVKKLEERVAKRKMKQNQNK